MRVRFFLYLILIWTSLVQLSCESQTKNSILIIAVDNLGFDDINCFKENTAVKSGIKLLCDEAIRYTHAFTTSTMSVPSLASLMTGHYPIQHGVRHNGTPALSPTIMTNSKTAVQLNYRTAFFSGGAPVLRKTGLSQGFEIFDDHIQPSEQFLFRPFSKTLGQFENWIKNEVDTKQFYSIIYAPDLLFTKMPTTSESGEARNLTYESQVEELDANLYRLFEFLKQEKLWNNTTIVFTGLHGYNNPNRENEIQPINLHSENTQVALFVKPQHKPRETEMQWKVDRNVSLADIGATIFTLLGEKNIPTGSTAFPVYSLHESFKKAQPNWPEDRWLLIESAWTNWHGWGGIRAAIVAGHDLFINDEHPYFFNTLTDRLEQSPLAMDNAIQEKYRHFSDELTQLGYSKWKMPSQLMPKIYEAFYLQRQRQDQSQNIQYLTKKIALENKISIYAGWAAQLALDNKDWKTLQELGRVFKNANWRYIAEKNLNVQTSTTDPCLSLLNKKTRDQSVIKKCSDQSLIDLLAWIQAEADKNKIEQTKSKFEQSWNFRRLEKFIIYTNISIGRIWDISELKEQGPALIELALALPEMQKLRQQIRADVRSPEAKFFE